MNREQLQRIMEISLLKDIFELENDEAESMFLSNDYKDIEEVVYQNYKDKGTE